MFKLFFLLGFLLHIELFYTAIADEPTLGQKDQNSCSDHSDKIEIDKIYGFAIKGLKTAAVTRQCSWDACEAAEAAHAIVMSGLDTTTDYLDKVYAKGSAKQVASQNRGLQNYFKKISESFPIFLKESNDLIEIIASRDKLFPLSESELKKPYIDQDGKIQPIEDRSSVISSVAKFNSLDLALDYTKGNVFRAVTLLSKFGHDAPGYDIREVKPTKLKSSSSLYARQNLGSDVEVSKEVLKLYEDVCQENIAFGVNQTRVRATNNYHMIAGFYLGCQLAKQGFGMLEVPKRVVDLLAKKMDYIKNIQNFKIKKADLFKGQLCDHYCIDVCEELPAALGFCYRKAVLTEYINEDAKILYAAGYTKPFQYRDGKFKKTGDEPFKYWTEDRLKKAVADLDLNLALIPYRSEQHRAGAIKGAKVCREYKEKMKPSTLREPKSDLAKDAEVLYDLGYFSLNLKVKDLKRHKIEDWTVLRKENALRLLQNELRKQPTRSFDYSDDIQEDIAPEVPK